MTKKEIEKAQELLEKWQQDHADVESLRAAYRAKVLDWVVKSMAFEGDHVNLEMLEEYMETLRAEKEKKNSVSSRKKLQKKNGTS